MKFVFWVGATAVGKSGLALHFAQNLLPNMKIPILNADSVQTYQRVDIGSAKPTPQERALTPHFLFDLLPPPEVMTAGEYNRHFFDWAKENNDHYPAAFVVGGTGFYFQAIEKGLLPIPPANPEIQAKLFDRLAREGEEALHLELKARDPESAGRIHPRDHYRLVRALDIILSTGKAPSRILKEHALNTSFPYPLLKLGLRRSKEELTEILRNRTEQMLNQGWLGEVEKLVLENHRDWEPLRSVGYKECVQYLDGEISSREELIQKVIESSQRLQKKQKTWFQRDSEIKWFHPSEVDGVAEALRRFLC